jgi:hypothetical protein
MLQAVYLLTPLPAFSPAPATTSASEGPASAMYLAPTARSLVVPVGAFCPMHADQWFLAHCLGRAAGQPLTHLSCCRLIIVSIASRPASKSRTPGKCSGQYQWQGQLQCLQPSSGRLQQRGGQDPRPTCRHAPGPCYR